MTKKLSPGRITSTLAFAFGLAALALLANCSNRGSTASSVRMERSTANEASQKLQNCTKLLMDSMEKPTTPFHFSYKAQENINTKYPMDKAAKPELGPVAVEADVSPDEIDVTSTRGKQTSSHKAKKGDEGAWAFAQMDLLGPMTGTGILLAFGQAVARPAGSDTVGGVATDKYDFDTSTATGSTKAGLDMAKAMITNIDNTKGTVWVDKATGRLTKFNMEAEFKDKAGNTWNEHYEGEVTPK